jgi:hypothetical protein
VANCLPVSSPPSDYPRYSLLSEPPIRPFSHHQRLSLPSPLLDASREGLGLQCYMDSEWVIWAHCSLHSLQTKRTPFLFKRFPFYLPHSGMCCLIPSPCLYPLDRSSSELDLFYYPLPPPTSLLIPIWCAFGPYFQLEVVFYASPFMLLTLHMIHGVQPSFSSSPLPPSSPNIVSLALVWILLRLFCLLFPDFVVGTGEGFESRVELSLRVLRV